MEFVTSRMRGEIARFDIVDKEGKVLVEKDKRINARNIREIEAAGYPAISVPKISCMAVRWQKTSSIRIPAK